MSTQPEVDHWQELYSRLSHLPSFPISNDDNIHVITSPKEFRQSLSRGIRNAKQRIAISSLYIGSSENQILSEIRQRLTQVPELQCSILIDYFRGTRLDDKTDKSTSSIAHIYSSIIHHFPKRAIGWLYHSPDASPLIKRTLPQRFNEGIGLQHSKIYIFDDFVIISGANLNSEYFTTRQDRYVSIRSKPLADYMLELIQLFGEHSFRVTCPPIEQNSESIQKNEVLDTLPMPKFEPPELFQTDLAAYKAKAEKAFIDLNAKWIALNKQKEISESQDDEDGDSVSSKPNVPETLVFPVIQAACFGIRLDEQLMASLLKLGCESNRWHYRIASGYLNLPEKYQELILTSRSSFEIMTGAPKSNGFYGSKGISKHLPAAYSFLEGQFLKRIEKSSNKKNILITEYSRPGWTWHAKGLFLNPSSKTKTTPHRALPHSKLPLLSIIGSSNLNYRSVNRDLETQVVLLTRNSDVAQKFENNWRNLVNYCDNMSSREFQSLPSRWTPMWIQIATIFLKRML